MKSPSQSIKWTFSLHPKLSSSLFSSITAIPASHPPFSGNHWFAFCYYRLVSFYLEFYINALTQYVLICFFFFWSGVWSHLLRINILRFICFVVCMNGLSFLLVTGISLYRYACLFIHSPNDEPLDCLSFLAIKNKVAFF